MTLKLLCQLRLILSSALAVFATVLLADPLVQCPAVTARVICPQSVPTLEITRPARGSGVTFRIGAIAQGSSMGERMMTLAPTRELAQMPLDAVPATPIALAVVGTEGPEDETCCVRNITVAAPDPAICAVPATPETPQDDPLPERQTDTQNPPDPTPLSDIALALTLQDICPEGGADHTCTGTLSLGVSGQPQGVFPLSLGHSGAENVTLSLSGPLPCYATGPTSQLCRDDAGVLGAGLDLPLTLTAPWSYTPRRIEVCAALGLPQTPRQLTYLVQTALNQIGMDAGTPDGQSGPRTRAAVAQLAGRFGLQTDDPTDPALLALLGLAPYADSIAANNRVCASTVLPPRPKPEVIPEPDIIDAPPKPRVPRVDTPAPPVCDRASTVARGGGCACRFSRMTRLSQSRCVCTATRGPPNDGGCP